jgi:hypothetical protein
MNFLFFLIMINRTLAGQEKVARENRKLAEFVMMLIYLALSIIVKYSDLMLIYL